MALMQMAWRTRTSSFDAVLTRKYYPDLPGVFTSPQLNPIERLWQFIKHQFKGENFSNLDELRQRVEHELAQMSYLLIFSLTSYDLILETLFHEALFYASS